LQVGNIIDATCPLAKGEDKNEIIRTHKPNVTNVTSAYELLPHNILLERIGGYNQKRGAKVVGHRGYNKYWCTTKHGIAELCNGFP